MNKEYYEEMLEKEREKGTLSCQHQAKLNDLRLEHVANSCEKAEEFRQKEMEYQDVIKSLKHDVQQKDDELDVLGAKLMELQEQVVEQGKLLEELQEKQKSADTAGGMLHV